MMDNWEERIPPPFFHLRQRNIMHKDLSPQQLQKAIEQYMEKENMDPPPKPQVPFLLQCLFSLPGRVCTTSAGTITIAQDGTLPYRRRLSRLVKSRS
jgi:hypothetical protein